jgi:hypothetical protein
MKKSLLISLSFVCMTICLSCNNNKSGSGSKDQVDKPAAVKTEAGFTGTYTTVENEMPMQFVLKEGGTGHENYHGDIRPFTWTKKGEKVFFKYDGEPTEFELPIYVDKGEIHYGSLVYKKE